MQNKQTIDSLFIEKLYENHRAEFIRWCYQKFSLNKEDAIDLYQDSIYDFYSKLKNNKLPDLNCDEKTYLFAIAKYKIYNHKRKYKDLVILPVDNGTKEIKESVPNMGEKNISEEENRKLVEEHLHKLNKKEREILKLYYYEEKSMKEIAEEMGYKNANVAKKMKFSSLKKLANLVKNKLSILIF